MTSLEEIQDPEANIPEGWHLDGVLVAEEVERLTFDFKAARCASSIPRRLGIQSNAEYLRADKKLGRRAANLALRALQWHKAAQPWMLDWNASMITARDDKEAYGEGARRQWTTWYYDRVTWLQHHIPRVARWGVITGKRQEANQLCSRLSGELRLLEEIWSKTAPLAWREPEDLPDPGLRDRPPDV